MLPNVSNTFVVRISLLDSDLSLHYQYASGHMCATYLLLRAKCQNICHCHRASVRGVLEGKKKATFWDTSSPLDAVHKISYPSGSLTYTNTQQILFPNTPHHNTYPFYNQIMKSYLLIVLFTFVSFTGFLVIMACSNNRRFSGINTTTRWYSSLPLCNVASK